MKIQPTPVPAAVSMIPVTSNMNPTGAATQPRTRMNLRLFAVASSLGVMGSVCVRTFDQTRNRRKPPARRTSIEPSATH